MDENVMKAPSLLDELAGVVRDIEVAESWDCTGDQMRCLDGSGCECAVRGCDRPDVEGDAVDFLRTHHAEIADMAKRLEAANALLRNIAGCQWFNREAPATVELIDAHLSENGHD